jgi:hypothetical protein
MPWQSASAAAQLQKQASYAPARTWVEAGRAWVLGVGGGRAWGWAVVAAQAAAWAQAWGLAVAWAGMERALVVVGTCVGAG